MKLNLVPTYVSKERSGKSAVFGSIALALVGVVIAVALTIQSKSDLARAQSDNEAAKPKAQAAVDTSAQADTIIASAAQIIKNSNLADAMIKHNDLYPDFYTKEIIPYIPAFFRINTLVAAPVDAATCTVTLVGTLSTQEQYGDLVLALMRIKGASSVARSGFAVDDLFVPGLSLDDQTGRPHKLTEAAIPDDPIDRLAYYQAKAAPLPDYLGVGNFGSGTKDPRGAIKDAFLVTAVITMSKDLQVPNPRLTLSGGGGVAAAAPAGGIPGGAGLPRSLPGGLKGGKADNGGD